MLVHLNYSLKWEIFINLFYAAQPVPSKAKESSSLFAMTLE
jgi:hypothetical protein